MTLSITDTMNNINEALFKNDVNLFMDKSIDFNKIFDNKLGEKIHTIDNIRSKHVGEDSQKLADFRKIVKKASEEAGVESSLDLTLARDINEIISQLKEAIKENSDLKSSGELTEDELSALQQQLSTLTNCLYDNAQVSEEFTSDIDTSIEFVEMQMAESVDEELVNSLKDLKSELDLGLDEEMLQDLNIETISSETDNSGGDVLMQNQSAGEQALKAVLNQDADAFDIKLQNISNAQNSQPASAKAVETTPTRILEQISKQMEALQNNSKVNIVLNPESLGKVNIQLMSTKEGLMAQFTVQTAEARDMLMKGLEGLKESLISQGVGVDNVSIKLSEPEKGSYNQDWTEQEGSRGGNKGDGQPNREEKEKGLFEKMMAQTSNNENGNV